MSVPVAARVEEATVKKLDILVKAPSTPYENRNQTLADILEEALVAE